MSKFKKAAAVASTVVLGAAYYLGGVKNGEVKMKKYSFAELITADKAKPLGRYCLADKKMSGFWAGNGIDINVKCKMAGIMRVYCDTNSKVYLAVFIDGVLQERAEEINSENGLINIIIPDGKHTVRIIRDNQADKDTSKYFYFDYLEFNGRITEKPALKKHFIEVIGDSIACGDGANGKYVAGESWKDPEDHSFVKGFAYKLADMLDADYSVVARGGIGLLGDTSGSQEKAGNKKITMQEIYDFTNGYGDMEKGENFYPFYRKPDLIVFEISGNDTTSMEDVWKQKVIDFLTHVSEKNGKSVPIVWSGRNEIHYKTILSVIEENALGNENLYACRYEYGGSGAAALKTQTAGHPSDEEQSEIAENLLKFIQDKEFSVCEKPEENIEPAIKKEKKTNAKKAGIIGGAVAGAAIGAAAIIFGIKKKNKK